MTGNILGLLLILQTLVVLSEPIEVLESTFKYLERQQEPNGERRKPLEVIQRTYKTLQKDPNDPLSPVIEKVSIAQNGNEVKSVETSRSTGDTFPYQRNSLKSPSLFVFSPVVVEGEAQKHIIDDAFKSPSQSTNYKIKQFLKSSTLSNSNNGDKYSYATGKVPTKYKPYITISGKDTLVTLIPTESSTDHKTRSNVFTSPYNESTLPEKKDTVRFVHAVEKTPTNAGDLTKLKNKVRKVTMKPFIVSSSLGIEKHKSRNKVSFRNPPSVKESNNNTISIMSPGNYNWPYINQNRSTNLKRSSGKATLSSGTHSSTTTSGFSRYPQNFPGSHKNFHTYPTSFPRYHNSFPRYHNSFPKPHTNLPISHTSFPSATSSLILSTSSPIDNPTQSSTESTGLPIILTRSPVFVSPRPTIHTFRTNHFADKASMTDMSNNYSNSHQTEKNISLQPKLKPNHHASSSRPWPKFVTKKYKSGIETTEENIRKDSVPIDSDSLVNRPVAVRKSNTKNNVKNILGTDFVDNYRPVDYIVNNEQGERNKKTGNSEVGEPKGESEKNNMHSYYELFKQNIFKILTHIQNNVPEEEFRSLVPSSNTRNTYQSSKKNLNQLIDFLEGSDQPSAFDKNNFPQKAVDEVSQIILNFLDDKITESNSSDRSQGSGKNVSDNEKEYEYYYVYYDEYGNEFIPDYVDFAEKNKIISPSDEFTKAFLDKHTSKLSAMLSKILKETTNNETDENMKTTTTKVPSLYSIITSQNVLTTEKMNQYTTASTERTQPSTNSNGLTTWFRTQAPSFTESSYVPSHSRPTTSVNYLTSEKQPQQFNSLQQEYIRKQSDSEKGSHPWHEPERMDSVGSSVISNSFENDWTMSGESYSTNGSPTTVSPTSSSVSSWERPQSSESPTGVKWTRPPVRNSDGLSTLEGIIRDISTVSPVKEAIPAVGFVGEGPSALETIAGAGAVALMAYGITYALPFTAPFVARRSDGKKTEETNSALTNFVDWIQNRRSSNKPKRRKIIKTKRRRPNPVHYDTSRENYPTYKQDSDKYSGDYVDEFTPIHNPSKKETSLSPSFHEPDTREQYNSNTQFFEGPKNKNSNSREDPQIKSLFDFAFENKDEPFGDDPTNEVFGEVKYEMDYSNTDVKSTGVLKPIVDSSFTTLESNYDHLTPSRESKPVKQIIPVTLGKPDNNARFNKRPLRRQNPNRKPVHNKSPTFMGGKNPNHVPNRSQNNRRRIPPGKKHQPIPVRPSLGSQNYNKISAEVMGRPVQKHSNKRRLRPRRPMQRPGQRRPMRRPMRPRARPKSSNDDVVFVNSNEKGEYPTYISVNQLNKLADEEMEGVVKGYNDRYQVPWPPSEGAVIITGSDFSERSDFNNYAISNLNVNQPTVKYRKPLDVSLDYSDFDYIDVKGSSSAKALKSKSSETEVVESGPSVDIVPSSLDHKASKPKSQPSNSKSGGSIIGFTGTSSEYAGSSVSFGPIQYESEERKSSRPFSKIFGPNNKKDVVSSGDVSNKELTGGFIPSMQPENRRRDRRIYDNHQWN